MSDNKKDLFLIDYSDKSFIVNGNDTLKYSEDLVKLGGKYIYLNIGYNWLFSLPRKKSLEKYIKTGVIEKFEYSKEEIKKFKLQNNNYNFNNINSFIMELKNCFKENEFYEGKNIINTILQLEDYYK